MKNIIYTLCALSITVACGKEDSKSVTANIRPNTDATVERAALQMLGNSQETAMTLALKRDIFGINVEKVGQNFVLSYVAKSNGTCFTNAQSALFNGDISRALMGTRFNFNGQQNDSAAAVCMDSGCGNLLIQLTTQTDTAQGTVNVILRNIGGIYQPTVSANPIFLKTYNVRTGMALCWQSNPNNNNGQPIPVNPITPQGPWNPYDNGSDWNW